MNCTITVKFNIYIKSYSRQMHLHKTQHFLLIQPPTQSLPSPQPVGGPGGVTGRALLRRQHHLCPLTPQASGGISESPQMPSPHAMLSADSYEIFLEGVAGGHGLPRRLGQWGYTIATQIAKPPGETGQGSRQLPRSGHCLAGAAGPCWKESHTTS